MRPPFSFSCELPPPNTIIKTSSELTYEAREVAGCNGHVNPSWHFRLDRGGAKKRLGTRECLGGLRKNRIGHMWSVEGEGELGLPIHGIAGNGGCGPMSPVRKETELHLSCHGHRRNRIEMELRSAHS